MLILPRPTHWLMAILLCAVSVAGQAPSYSPEKRLATVQTFAFGRVGYGGAISEGEAEFKYIVSQPAFLAISAFDKIYATGNPQGKAYALAGMKKLDPPRFRELLVEVTSSSVEVRVMRGCIISRKTLGEIANQIDRKEFRL